MRWSMGVLVALLALPVAASELKMATKAEVELLPDDPDRFPRMMAEVRAAAEARRAARTKAATTPGRPGQVTANAVADVRSVGLMVFPAAGSVGGLNGTYFRSDITLVNYDDEKQDVVFYWLGNGAATNNLPALRLRLDPLTIYTFEDFVATQFQRTGLGGMYAVPVVGEATDTEASIDGYSRIWTNQPNATGTVSQPFPGTDPFSFYTLTTATIFGLRNDAAYRTNFGLLNLDPLPHTFNITYVGSTGLQNQATVRMEPNTMMQASIPGGDYGHLYIRVTTDDPNAWWMTYASSTDNITGDGWVSIGSGVLTPQELDVIEARRP